MADNLVATKLNDIIHNKLLPLQQRFLSFEKLANSEFRFSSHHFSKAVESIQEVIDFARTLTKEE